MKNTINKFYLNRYTFIISSLVAIIGFIAWGINWIALSNYGKTIYAFIFSTLIIMLFIVYKKGETNLQKMLLGGLLTYMLFNYLGCFITYLQNPYLGTIITWSCNSVLIIIVFISHMRQQMDHKGSSISTVVNQCCGIMLVGTVLRQIEHFYENYITLAAILWTISSFATYIFIISMETRINEYKKIRTAKKAEGCWTEEERQNAKKIFSL